MLTLKEINEITFRKTNFSGYKPEDVNEFIDEVVLTVEALAKENQTLKMKTSEIAQKNTELREKLQILAKKVESYRQDEDGIKKALLSAQKLGNASLKEAKLTADQVLEEANAKADAMVEEAKKKTNDIIAEHDDKILGKKKEYEVIKEEVTNFRSSLFELYRNHITAVEEIPDFSKEIKAQRESKRLEEIKKVAQAPVAKEPTPVAKAPVVNAPAPAVKIEETIKVEIKPEIEELEEIKDEMFIDFKPEEIKIEKPVAVAEKDFPEIDFNAYSNIPEALKKEKSEFFNTLEFGEDIDIRKK